MRAMLAVLVALFLSACCGCASAPTCDALHDTTLRLEFGHGICSGTAIGPHTILTAQHCLKNDTLKLVNNKPVKVTGIGRDKHDALTLRLSGITFKTWARMGHMPHQGDRIRWWGNPRIGNMIARDVYREGHVAALEDGLIIYDASICFGDSGSGIFNDRGEVVGVISAMTDFNGCTFMLAYPL